MVFIKDGQSYRIPEQRTQIQQAFKSGLSHYYGPVDFKLVLGKVSFTPFTTKFIWPSVLNKKLTVSLNQVFNELGILEVDESGVFLV